MMKERFQEEIAKIVIDGNNKIERRYSLKEKVLNVAEKNVAKLKAIILRSKLKLGGGMKQLI